MTTQHSRRGEDWLLKKGGFQRLSISNTILKHLKNGSCTPEIISRNLKNIDAKDQMLLLNLLGGRLALGYRLVGGDVESLKRKSTDDLDRIFRRIERVGDTLSKVE